jgi:hypothetical protein
MSKYIPTAPKPYAIVFRWKEAKPGMLDVREYFATEAEARACLRLMTIPSGVEKAEVMKYEVEQ